MSEKKYRKVAEYNPSLTPILDERRSLVNQLKVVEQRLATMEADNYHRKFLLIEKSDLVDKIRDFNLQIKGRGYGVNDALRNVLMESLPKEFCQQLLDEANARLRTGICSVVPVAIMSEEDFQWKEKTKLLQSQVEALKKRIAKVSDHIQSEMPNLNKISDNDEYLQAVKLQKILSRIQAQLL